MVKPECLYTRFEAQCKNCERNELKVVIWGKLSKAVFFQILLGFYSIFRDKDALFLWVWGGHLLHQGLLTYFRGDGVGQKVCLALAIFLQHHMFNTG